MSGDSTMVLVKPNGQKRAQQTLPPPGIRLSSAADEWPHPFFRAEILEYRPRGGDSDFDGIWTAGTAGTAGTPTAFG